MKRLAYVARNRPLAVDIERLRDGMEFWTNERKKAFKRGDAVYGLKADEFAATAAGYMREFAELMTS